MQTTFIDSIVENLEYSRKYDIHGRFQVHSKCGCVQDETALDVAILKAVYDYVADERFDDDFSTDRWDRWDRYESTLNL